MNTDASNVKLNASQIEGIEKYATASTEAGSKFQTLLIELEPVVNGWLAEGKKATVYRDRLVKHISAHMDTMDSRTNKFANVQNWLQTKASEDLLRVVNMAERRTVVRPVFELAEMDVNDCEYEFLARWDKLAAVATAQDIDMADVLVEHVAPNASKLGKFNKTTHNKAVKAITPEPVEIPQAEDATPEAEAIDLGNDSIRNAWHDFEAKVFGADLNHDDTIYILEGMQALAQHLSA
tara:strand:+ start:219 stop:929 length:711 start_codon:yes stop_codon:yes gene_type:complete